jgi:phage tail sheath protein FI
MDYKFPGVYPTITDLSQVVSANSVISCAYVGMAEFGPINKPTLITNVKGFNQKFGKLDPKYGYEGFSLAVAADTINQHYFVRVVGEDARFGAAKFASEDTNVTQPTEGYTADEVKNAQLDSNALFANDSNSAFIVVANDPNDRQIHITIENSTINENKNHKTLSTGYDASKVMAYITLAEDKSLSDEQKKTRFAKGDIINVTNTVSSSGTQVAEYDGKFVVEEFDGDKVWYKTTNVPTIVSASGSRVQKMVPDNETTFRVKVLETSGKTTTTVETYDYVTLYPAKDNYGNSMFVEDVINGESNYVQIFVNGNIEDKYVPAEVENITLVGGNGGSKPEAKAYIDGWKLFNDRSQYNINLLVGAGNVQEDNYAIQSAMLEVAEKRRDCFCLFDTPVTETTADEALEWRKDVQGFNSYRGAIFSPWVKTFNAVQGKKNFLMPPSAYIAKIIGACGDPWIAPAGPNRGQITSSIVTPTALTDYYDDTEGGVLYDKQINCIIKDAVGYTNWGQKTLQQKPSALDRINVARTVMYIETTLRDAARYHLFENNTAYERMQITLQFNNFLDEILNAGGLSKYTVVCDTSNNTPQVIQNNQLVIDIYLWPVYCAEVIKLNTIVMGADAQVSVTSSN